MNEIELSNYNVLYKYKTLDVFYVNKLMWDRHGLYKILIVCLTHMRKVV